MTEPVLVYDAFAGVAGDMHLGALVDLGVPEDWLRDELARLPVSDEFELRLEPGAKQGIHGTRATVRLASPSPPERHLADIEAIVRDAGYGSDVEDAVLAMFRTIAEAEAAVHRCEVEAVHFHEVGATDAIVDLTAAALCLAHLAPRRIYCAQLELGGGTVRCAHGLMPVPAPATLAILKGVPWRSQGVDGEATTPTGAAILRQAVDEFRAPSPFVCRRIGYGIGHRDFERPNVLRVMLGEASGTTPGAETAVELHCNLDDMSPEAFEPLFEVLFAAGARDVFLTPVTMKKSRPGNLLTVLCEPSLAPRLRDLLFAHSTTIGVRELPVARTVLDREQLEVETSLGQVSVKRVRLPDGGSRFKPEHDDVARLARDHGLPYPEAARRLDAEIRQRLGAS